MTHVLITGHTGFKGAWLAVLMTRMGYAVSGLALDPEEPSLFSLAGIGDLCTQDFRCDIRDATRLQRIFQDAQPDVLVHLAAQPLVRRSFAEPCETVTTNVVGTMNVLDAASRVESLRATLIITTDKVYRPGAGAAAFAEVDPLGGDDIYSASKAMADMLTHAWTHSFMGPATAIARAGNVIGGGDFGRERLVPDLVHSITTGQPLTLRYPDAVRPWQHVLDCLSGYATIVDELLANPSMGPAEAWNVGPGERDFATVADVTAKAFAAWGADATWQVEPTPAHAENPFLTLDSTRLRRLGWSSRLTLDQSIEWTMDWYQRVHRGEDPLTVTSEQVERFISAKP